MYYTYKLYYGILRLNFIFLVMQCLAFKKVAKISRLHSFRFYGELLTLHSIVSLVAVWNLYLFLYASFFKYTLCLY